MWDRMLWNRMGPPPLLTIGKDRPTVYIKTDNSGHESFETGFQSDVLRNVVDLWENTPDEDFAQVLGNNLFEDIYDTAESIEEQNAAATAEHHDIPIEEVVRKYALDEIPIEGYRSPQGAAMLYSRAAHEMADLAFSVDPHYRAEPDRNMVNVCNDAVMSGPIATLSSTQLPRTEKCLGAVVQPNEQESLTIDAMRSGDFDQIAASRLAHGVGMDTPLVAEIAAAQPSVTEAYEKLDKLITRADSIADKPEATKLNRYRRISDLMSNAPDDLTLASGDTVSFEPLRDYADYQVTEAMEKTSLLKTHNTHKPQANNSIDLGF